MQPSHEPTGIEILLVGGGLASLTLADEILSARPKLPCRVTVVDPRHPERLDRTWCAWVKPGTDDPRWQAIESHSWSKLAFRHPEWSQSTGIAPYRYRKIQGPVLHQHLEERLRADERFSWVEAQVRGVSKIPGPHGTRARVLTDSGALEADLAFVSVPSLVPDRPEGEPRLLQHFLGWTLQAPTPLWDPHEATLMDFRVPQLPGQGTCFIYLIPETQTRALVEVTVFSPSPWSEAQYESVFWEWLQAQYPGIAFERLEREQGAIPMVGARRPRADFFDAPVVPIGSAAGRIKPSTGYAFQRIQEHNRWIVSRLTQLLGSGTEPLGLQAATARLAKARFSPPRRSARYRLYDRLLLDRIARDGQNVNQIFLSLFQTQPWPRVLAFLDEQTSLREEVSIFWALPWPPFLKSLLRVSVRELLGSRRILPAALILGSVAFLPEGQASNLSTPVLVAGAGLWVLLGISHGGLDHIHEARRSQKPMLQVLARYLATVGALALLMVYLPLLGLGCFVGVSAWHFGKTEFPEAGAPRSFLWGLSLLTWAILAPWGETAPMLRTLLGQATQASESLLAALELYRHGILAAAFVTGVGAALGPSRREGRGWLARAQDATLFELWCLGFAKLPFAVAFSLFFVLDHSRKSWLDQARALGHPKWSRLAAYALPTTLGALLLLGLAATRWQGAWPAVFALLSAVTLPHAWVMSRLPQAAHPK